MAAASTKFKALSDQSITQSFFISPFINRIYFHFLYWVNSLNNPMPDIILALSSKTFAFSNNLSGSQEIATNFEALPLSPPKKLSSPTHVANKNDNVS